MLDRLRACVVASYYASSFAKPQDKHMVESGAAHHPAIQVSCFLLLLNIIFILGEILLQSIIEMVL